jgi:hypothetical protein
MAQNFKVKNIEHNVKINLTGIKVIRDDWQILFSGKVLPVTRQFS